MKNLFQEFKEFAIQGNAFDLAIGVVIGAAFGQIVSSLVQDIIMPIVSFVLGAQDFSNLTLTLRTLTVNGQPEPVVLRYGLFIEKVVDFVVISVVVFAMIKLINVFKHKSTTAITNKAKEKSSESILLEKILKEIKK